MKIPITLGALLTATAAFGQGQFVFNTHDPSVGNNIIFYFKGELATGPDLFVQVFAGPDAAHLYPVIGTTVPGPLPLNRTGAGAGYTNPFGDIYTVPGMSAGATATVGYVPFQGASLSTATAQGPLMLAMSPVILTEPPTPPNEVALGTNIPEPSTAALGLLALAVVLTAQGRKSIFTE